MYRDDVIIPLGLSSMIIQSVLFAWVHPRIVGSEVAGVWRGALKFGLFAGTLAWSFAVLPVAAKYRMSSMQDFIALETAFTLLQFSVVSPLIAWAYRSRPNEPAT